VTMGSPQGTRPRGAGVTTRPQIDETQVSSCPMSTLVSNAGWMAEGHSVPRDDQAQIREDGEAPRPWALVEPGAALGPYKLPASLDKAQVELWNYRPKALADIGEGVAREMWAAYIAGASLLELAERFEVTYHQAWAICGARRKTCPTCGRLFSCPALGQIHCSTECATKARMGRDVISDEVVAQIREAYQEGVPTRVLGERFGVSQSWVSVVVKGHKRREAPGPIGERNPLIRPAPNQLNIFAPSQQQEAS